MCGIVGAIKTSDNSFQISEDYLIRMRDTMVHRGPDGSGVWVSESKDVGLAHRRLSIIDLSNAANQPMFSNDKKIKIIFNGEIYNHRELKQEISKFSHAKWQTDHSDTEVILRAYELWGIDCLNKLYGMFAIAIWDENINELFLIRDRIGIKPLYWSSHNGRLTFASEIKALLEDPSQNRQVDNESFQNYFTHICTPGNKTLFKGIFKLQPGTYLKVNKLSGEIKTFEWYEMLTNVTKTSLKENEIYEHLLEILTDAVQIRKVSDVPVGVFLSGGVDSSTNATLFSKNETNPINTFSIGYEQSSSNYTNELHHAKFMSEIVSSKHFEKILSIDEVMSFIPKMIHLQDEPIGDPVCIPLYFVSKLAKENGVTVCQVGEGADEIFGGYSIWREWIKLQNILDSSAGKPLSFIGKRLLELTGNSNHRAYDILQRANNNRPAFRGGAEGLTEYEKKIIFSNSYLKDYESYDNFSAIEPIWQNFQSYSEDKSPLSWMSYLDLKLRLSELLLMRVDKMTMGVSLEARVPFLDHRLVEFALSIPENLKIKKATSKNALKQAVKNELPNSIINRKKQGFGAPVHDWFLGKLGEKVRAEIKSFCYDTDYFDYSGIEKILDSKSSAHAWYIYNFVLWHRHFIER